MDRETEFQKNTEFDRFALYLRPLDNEGQPLYVSEATEAQKRWGGLHVTLCGFAPKKVNTVVEFFKPFVKNVSNVFT